MATLNDFKQTRTIKYSSRDFDALVNDLKNYLKNQFPNTYNDFSDTSSGMAFLELVAYVGDILNFYLDKQFNELFTDRAQERKNLVSLSKNLGYKLRGKTASTAFVTVTATYPTTGSLTSNLDFTLQKGTTFSTGNGVYFETVSDINFGTISSRNVSVLGNNTTVSVSGIKCINGLSKFIRTTINNPTPFLRITLPESNVLEVTSVTSSDGYTWYEADYLAQESQFYGAQNTTSTSASAPYVLTLRKIPRRFITEKDANNYLTLTFGSGILSTSDSDYIPNPSDFVLPATVRGVEDGFAIAAIDPQNFINTGTLGAAPSSTTLTTKYRVGGGLNTNVGINTITIFSNKKISYTANISTSASQRALMESQMTVTNDLPASGGLDEESLTEIRQYASLGFAGQNRLVTAQDYIARSFTLPSGFGSPFRVSARRDEQTDSGIKLNVIARNDNGTLATPSTQLKLNLGNYLAKFKMLNDNINIVNGKIINIQVMFSISTSSLFASDEVLANCLLKLKKYFAIENWQLGQQIVIPRIQSYIQDTEGVLAVGNVIITNITGLVNNNTYSSDTLNISNSTRNGIIQIDNDSIFEVKYPDIDIKGSIIA